MLQTLPPAETIETVLKRAVETDTVNGRFGMGVCLRHIPPFKPGSKDRLIRDHKDLWLALIQDDRSNSQNPDYSVSNSFLQAYERLFLSKDINLLMAQYPKLCRQFARQRVYASLNGAAESELEPYPEDAKLTESRQTRLVGRFKSLTSLTGAADLINGLALPERVALPDIMGAAAALNPNLGSMANILTRIDANQAPSALSKKMSGWIGKPITKELIDDLYAYCLDWAKAGNSFLCLIARDPELRGCQITFRSSLDSDKRMQDGFLGLACAPGIYSMVVEDSDQSAVQAFRNALKKIVSPQVNLMDPFVVKFQKK
jgi:hypothetical protein